MDWLCPHEPVSAWTHGLWMLAAIPAGALLMWRNRHDPAKWVGMTIFSITLVACFAASAFFHAAPEGPRRNALHTLDYVGIYLLIAGSGTPIALGVLRGRWRRWLLVQLWVLAAAGAVLRLTVGMPSWLGTGFYLAMGWVGVVAYFELARRVSHRALLSLWAGGICYSIGAAINLTGWPDPWPKVVGFHELFHLWVMAGSACHYWFVLKVVTPYRPLTALAPGAAGEGEVAALPAVDTSPAGGGRLDPAHTFLES